jgi:hypothetical protein
MLIHQVFHRAFPQTSSFREGHSTARRPNSSSPLLLQTAVKNNVAIILLKSLRTPTLQPLDKCFFGPLNSYLNIEASSCNITR